MLDKYFIHGKLNEDGTGITFENKHLVSRVLGPWLEKDLIITLEEFKNKRSDRQNRYLHGVILPSIIKFELETTGTKYTTDTIKTFIYTHVLNHEVIIEDYKGKEVMYMKGKHFSEMNTKEFSDAKEIVQEYYAKQGLVIPDPVNNNLMQDFL